LIGQGSGHAARAHAGLIGGACWRACHRGGVDRYDVSAHFVFTRKKTRIGSGRFWEGKTRGGSLSRARIGLWERGAYTFGDGPLKAQRYPHHLARLCLIRTAGAGFDHRQALRRQSRAMGRFSWSTLRKQNAFSMVYGNAKQSGDI